MLQIDSFLQDIEPILLEYRRNLHAEPELGFTEYKTTYMIGKALEQLGFTIFIGKDALKTEARIGLPSEAYLQYCEASALEAGVPSSWLEKMSGGHTGLVATFDTKRPGKHIALRFDIDSLPIHETDELSHYPKRKNFRSNKAGVMHACAHDGHAAIGIGVAHFIQQFQSQLTGKFTLLFQPAEEGGRGAKAMVEKGWLDGVDLFIGGHIGIHSLTLGEIAATTNEFLATTKINVTYEGVSAHAGISPQTGKNALLAAAAASLHLAGIPRHGSGATRINVGKLEAGSGRNIIPDLAKMEVETRGETTELNEYMESEAKRIIASVGQLYDVETRLDIVGAAEVAECDKEWIEWVREACSESHKITTIHPCLPLKGSEDVTYMMNAVRKQGGKATYFIFGTPLTAGHHHPAFDFDEQVLSIAVETIARTVHYLSHAK
ncbi:amidohydrolase [Bacillus kwashiorkori]|uniref:amidohydrolase n=1 Tax=Bacillus kwashiorkori TaxID=1522318 RepID=UPI000782A8E2|nr:amidohydrolase [Bacillus kwashiorkori]